MDRQARLDELREMALAQFPAVGSADKAQIPDDMPVSKKGEVARFSRPRHYLRDQTYISERRAKALEHALADDPRRFEVAGLPDGVDNPDFAMYGKNGKTPVVNPCLTLVQCGGMLVFPPVALPPPHLYAGEVEANWRMAKLYGKDRQRSLGLFAMLPESLIMRRFIRVFQEEELLRMSEVSRYWNVYAEDEERWKRLAIRRMRGDFCFKGSWKRTCLLKRSTDPLKKKQYKLFVEGFYSHRLYGEYYRGRVSIEYFKTLPSLDTGVKRVDYVQAKDLSVPQFVERYGFPNKPVVIHGAIDHWPARKKWTYDQLNATYGKIRFKTDEVDADGSKFKMKLRDYLHYAATNFDEDPIYLFDPCFDERAPQLLKDYQVPEYFEEDLLNVLGSHRPDYMWLVLGAERSGSPFHTDPYQTSAFNAVLQGNKRWLLYPPNDTPPGVDVDSDDDDDDPDYDADEPIKYMVEHYVNIKKVDRMPLEIFTGPGDMIYVPSGWWHMVLNVDDSCAVTQNSCTSYNFARVFEDMSKPCNRKINARFRRLLRPIRPDLARQYGFMSADWR